MKLLVVTVVMLLALTASGASRRFAAVRRAENGERAGTVFQRDMGHPGAANCTTLWVTQHIDHFSFGAPSGSPTSDTYQQKVLVYDQFFKPGGPIFFYCGNEGPIDAFADISGLMWQHAASFNAALVWAEHRFFGDSQPCGGSCMQHLSTMQALADYAALLVNVTSPGGRYATSQGIVLFGGSYGGMLAAWAAMKYPNLITGAVASSAPIGMVSDSFDTSLYWRVVTRDATGEGNAAPECAANVHAALQTAMKMVATPSGAAEVSSIFASCSPVPTGDAGATLLGYFVQSAFDIFAMGNAPYPLDFFFGDATHPAPAWPMRVACDFMRGNLTGTTLVRALAQAVNVMYNVTLNVPCNNLNVNPTTAGAWDYMVCSERVINELPYFAARGPPNDMFWPQQPWTHNMYIDYCAQTYDLRPRFGFLNTTYGAGNVRGAENIVFNNGAYDPWHSGGILGNVSASVRAYLIPEGSHHLDLFFSSPQDPPMVQWVRDRSMQHVREWLAAARKP